MYFAQAMTSLASEIQQLHELLKCGALTPQEFQSAKEAAIQLYTSRARCEPSGTAPAATNEANGGSLNCSNSGSGHTSCSTTVVEQLPKNMDDWVEAWAVPPHQESRVALQRQALSHLHRILSNIIDHPNEPKFCGLRCGNPRLRAELFSMKASTLLLRRAGFQLMPTDISAEVVNMRGEGGGRNDMVNMQWRLEGSSGGNRGDVPAAVQEAMDIVMRLQQFFDEQQARQYQLQRLLASVSLEVRMEAARAAVASEDVESNEACPTVAFFVKIFSVDEAGDDLYTSIRSLRTLKALYESIALSSTTAEAALQLTCRGEAVISLVKNAAFYEAIVQQSGGFELMTIACAAQLCREDEKGDGGAAPPATGPTLSSSETPDNRSGCMYSLKLIPEGVGAVEHSSRCVRLIAMILAGVLAVQQEKLKAAREAAELAMRRELRRARAEDGVKNDPLRRSVVSSVASRALHGRSLSISSASDSSNEEEEATQKTESQSRHRIPIAEAMKILMGRKL